MSVRARVSVYFNSCFILILFLNETFQRIKMLLVRCGLTTQSTIFCHVGILALLPWNLTCNVLSKFAFC